MNIKIPSYFDNFKQRLLQRGLETCSTTEYKGYQIFMRAYKYSGISYTIFKIINNKKIKYRSRQVNFEDPVVFLQHAKNYIDNKLINNDK